MTEHIIEALEAGLVRVLINDDPFLFLDGIETLPALECACGDHYKSAAVPAKRRGLDLATSERMKTVRRRRRTRESFAHLLDCALRCGQGIQCVFACAPPVSLILN